LNRLRFQNGIVANLGGASLPHDAVRTTRRFLRHDPPRPRELHAIRFEVRRQLEDTVPPAGRGDVMVALGGTVRTLASIHLRAHPGERKHRNGLRLWQSDIILASAIVIEKVMVFGGYLTLAVCSSGVRDAVLRHETFAGRR
jgi:exopolyphosphatase/pppGpp-phosphohydrolase